MIDVLRFAGPKIAADWPRGNYNGGMITVKHLEGVEWLVTVEGARTTQHRVSVSEAEAKRFGAGRPVEELLRASFEFLLERESNSSILSSFELSVIGRYFPEYEKEIGRYPG